MNNEHKHLIDEALIASVAAEYEQIPQGEAPEEVLSPAFVAWAEGVTERPAYPAARGVLRKVILAALIAIAIAGLVAVSAYVYHKQVRFDYADDGGEYVVTFDPAEIATASKHIDVWYTVDYVPEGFVLEMNDTAKTGTVMYWKNQDREDIVFDQGSVYWNPLIRITKWEKRESQIMGEYTVDILYLKDCRILVWTDSDYIFTLSLTYGIDDTEMEKIFLSIRPREGDEIPSVP